MITVNDPTREFLAILHRGGNHSYWWTTPHKRSLWWPVETPATLPNGRSNVYFGIHPVNEIPPTNAQDDPKPPESVRSQIRYIAAVNCVFAEFDAKRFSDSKEATLQHIEALSPAPSVIIDSGGGYHCYWLLDEPVYLRDDAAKKKAADLQMRWVAYVKSDDGAKDLARVLRVPGTKNFKYDPAPNVQFIRCDLDLRYTLDELDAACKTPTSRQFDTTQPATAEDNYEAYAQAACADEVAKFARVKEGDRNTQLNKAAFNLAQFFPHRLLNERTVRRALEGVAEEIGLPKHEIAATIDSGFDAGKKEPRKLPERDNEVNGDDTTPRTKKRMPSSQQIRDDLHDLGYTFRYNAVTLSMEVNGKPISDAIEATIRMQMRDQGYKNVGAVADVYTSLAHTNTYHPVRDYLDSRVWDGNLHISKFAMHFACVDKPVTYQGGKTVGNLFYTYLYRWMIGAVAKVYEQAQNMMLVVVGPQGIGKSTVAEWVCSPLSDYFIEQAIQTDDKDYMLRLAKHFIWEVDELDGTIRKSDVAALKGFITRKHVVARPAYARRDIHAPALASLIGTVNKGAGFLVDATGNRRFYVVEVSAIDWAYTKLDVNQMWAQAVHDYKAGVAEGRQPWVLQSSERVAQAEANKGHEVRTLLDDWIDTDLCLDGGPDVGMTAAEIVDHLRTCNHFLTGTGRAQAMEVAEALLRRGVTRAQATIGGVRGMYYLRVTKSGY